MYIAKILDQLGNIRTELESRNIEPIYEYWSGSEGPSYGDLDNQKKFNFDRKGTIKSWKRTGGIMISIKCLDEGVNIPSISHGIIWYFHPHLPVNLYKEEVGCCD